MKTIIVITAVLLTVGGCATVGERAVEAGTTGSVRFQAADVDAAILIAQQARDTVAEACYRAIRAHVDPEAQMAVVGPVSAYAAGRVRVRQSRAGLAPDVHVACSPLIVDAGTFSGRLLRKFSGSLIP